MTGKGTEKAREPLANLIVDAVQQVADDGEVDTDHIKIEKKDGAVVEESTLIQGVIIDKEKVHPGMPSELKDAKVVLINSPLEVKETEVDAEIRITDPAQKSESLTLLKCKHSLNKKNKWSEIWLTKSLMSVQMYYSHKKVLMT